MNGVPHEVSIGAKRSRDEAHLGHGIVNRANNQAIPTPTPKRPRWDTDNHSSGAVSSSSGEPHETLAVEPAYPCTSVETFVVANSAVVKAALQDDASASWRLAFPPSSTINVAAWERTLRNLAVLEKLHAEEPAEWMRILQVRTRSLYASISGCSGEELAEMLHLTEYLQLPKPLAVRLNMQVEVLRLGKRLRSVFTGDQLLAVLESSEVLKPAVAAAKVMVAAPLAHADYFCMSSVWDGACGFLCDPFPDELERLLEEDEDAVNEVADRVGSFVAGQLLVGAIRIRDVPRIMCRISGAPGAVAAYHSDIAQLKALTARGWNMKSALMVAFARSRVPVLEWWYAHAYTAEAASEVPEDVFFIDFEAESRGQRLAAARGHVDVFRWMDDNEHFGGMLQPGLDALAVRRGRWRVLKFLRREVDDYPRSGSACRIAAGAGKLRMLQYLVSEGYSLDAHVVTAAAAGGHIAVLQYALELGVEFPRNVCDVAAGAGRLETLQWLRSGAPPHPWSASTIRRAERAGHAEVAAWARANGCPAEDPLSEPPVT